MIIFLFWPHHSITIVDNLLYKLSFLEIIWKRPSHSLWPTILSTWAHYLSTVVFASQPKALSCLAWKGYNKMVLAVVHWPNFTHFSGEFCSHFPSWAANWGLIEWLASDIVPFLQSLGFCLDSRFYMNYISCPEHLATTSIFLLFLLSGLVITASWAYN